jgi:Rod binding domain-containing protein
MSDLRTPQWGQAGAEAVPAQLVPAVSPRLVNAAHEFEAAMMKELMAPLSSGDGSPEGDEDAAGSESAITSFAGEALGKAISEHGGFGIANRILHQLTAASNHSRKTDVSKHGNGTATNSPL